MDYSHAILIYYTYMKSIKLTWSNELISLNRGIHNKYFKVCICVNHLKVIRVYVFKPMSYICSLLIWKKKKCDLLKWIIIIWRKIHINRF